MASWGLFAGTLLIGPWLAHRLVGIRWGRLTGERAVVSWVLWLGVGALASAGLDPQLRPSTLGLHLTRSWLTRYGLSAVVGGICCYPLVRGLFGAPVASAPPISRRRILPWLATAVVMGIVEEYSFRGVWSAVGRRALGPFGAALLANGLYALLLSTDRRLVQLSRRAQTFWGLGVLTLYGFGLSLSWAYAATHSLAVPAGLHTAAYYVFHRRPRARTGGSPATWRGWLGREDPALGLGPVAIYWIAAAICIRWFSTTP